MHCVWGHYGQTRNASSSRFSVREEQDLPGMRVNHPQATALKDELLKLLLQGITSAGISLRAHKPEILPDAFARQ